MGLISKLFFGVTYLSVGTCSYVGHGLTLAFDRIILELEAEKHPPSEKASLFTKNTMEWISYLSLPSKLYHIGLWPLVWYRTPSISSRLNHGFKSFTSQHSRPWNERAVFLGSNEEDDHQGVISLKSEGMEDHFRISFGPKVGPENITIFVGFKDSHFNSMKIDTDGFKLEIPSSSSSPPSPSSSSTPLTSPK